MKAFFVKITVSGINDIDEFREERILAETHHQAANLAFMAIEDHGWILRKLELSEDKRKTFPMTPLDKITISKP